MEFQTHDIIIVMKAQELARLSGELEVVGHAKTSYKKLGLSLFEALAYNLRTTVEATPHFLAEQAQTPTGMIMCKDKESKKAGRALMEPIVGALFAPHLAETAGWDMYTINYYFEPGHFFKPHQDYLEEGTVTIISALGVRRLDVYKKEDEDDVFNEIDVSYELGPGDILLLDAARDLGHAATCHVSPSISVVGDIPTSVRAA